MPVFDPGRDEDAVVPAGRLATVWPCPPDGPGRPPAGWLQNAVEQLVAVHTGPGDPVLLLTPPPPYATPTGGPGGTCADRLAATGWAVARLHRTVHVRSAPANADPRPSESGPGLDLPSPWPDSDRRTLVVTVVEPTRTAWIHTIRWAQLVTPTSLLAVITHSDSVAGWLVDPTGDLTTATSRHGLTQRDRFVLLEVPLDTLDQPPAPLPPGAVPRRVHSDLLLFAPVGMSAGRQECR